MLLAAAACTVSRGQITYTLNGTNANWPADKRADIIEAMEAAVSLYNSNGYFVKSIRVNYRPGAVPTAQANYNGDLDFGGSIGTRVALHEIAHTLGAGTHSNWVSKRIGGHWVGTYASNRAIVFDGPGSLLGCDAAHFWPYGLNYDTEDSSLNRIRHIKMVSALRRDLGIVADSDSDGMPDDWETFQFGTLSQTAGGDADTDGTSNLDEYNTDSNASTYTYTWAGLTSSNWVTIANWSNSATAAPTGGTYYCRLSVNNNTNHPIVYTAAQGTTRYFHNTAGGRGLVIGSGSANAGTLGQFIIQGGSFSTLGSQAPDVIGNGARNAGTLLLADGLFRSSNLHLGVTGGGEGTLHIQRGTATIDVVGFNFSSGGTGIVQLSGGVLATDGITEFTSSGTHLFRFDGGTLRATASNPAFLQGLTSATVGSNGAVVDSGAYLIAIAQSLSAAPGSLGGFTKLGAGTNVLGGSNSFAGPTIIAAGSLQLTNGRALPGTATVSNGATLALGGGITCAPAGPLTISGAGSGSRGALQSDEGANTWNAPVIVGLNATRIGVQDGAALTVAGSITEASAGLSVRFRSGASPADKVVISGASNAWTGITEIFSTATNGGAVVLGRHDALPTGAVLAVAGNGVAGLLDLNGFNQAAAGLTNSTGGASPIGAGLIVNNGPTPATLTLRSAIIRTYAGSIQDGSNPVHVTIRGPSTQRFTNLHSYTGTTRVEAGTFSLVTPGLLASPVLVTGGIFTGNGIVSNTVTVAAGVHQPGNPQGSMATGPYALHPAGTLRITVAGTNASSEYNSLRSTGPVELGGTLQLIPTTTNVPAGSTLLLIQQTGTNPVQGAFTGLPEGAEFFSSNQWWRITYAGNDGNDVVLTRLAPTAWLSWRQNQFGASVNDLAQSGPFADPNFDRVVNLLEFYLARDPLAVNPAGSLPQAAFTPTHLALTYARSAAAAAELNARVECSDTLEADSWTTNGVTESILGVTGTVEYVEATVPPGPNGRRFLRLNVFQP
jgi:autotransporter-associated beta strand protein